MEGNAIVSAVPFQLQDVNTLKVQKELQSALWQYKVVSDFVYAVAHQNRDHSICTHQGFLAEVNKLKGVSDNIWKAMDNSHDHLSRADALQQASSAINNISINLTTFTQTEGLRTGDVPFDLLEVLPLGWKHPDWNLSQGGRMATVEAKCLSFMPTWVDNADSAPQPSRCSLLFKSHRLFYLIVAVLYLAVFLSFAVLAGNPEAFNTAVTANRPGGFGKPFLKVPPQYNFGQSQLQSMAIPIVYGIMHSALLSLGLMPIPMCKGRRAFEIIRSFFGVCRCPDDFYL